MRKFLIILMLFINKALAGIVVPINNTNIHSSFSGKAFVISIGVDVYSDSQYNLVYCQSDAEYFLNYIKKDTSIKELVAYKFRNYSTKEQIIEAINKISKIATKHDLFVFYYAGCSKNSNLLLSNDSLSYVEIIKLTQDIYSERQLYVSDASNGEQFKTSFVNYLKQKPQEKYTSKTDRILITMLDYALELNKGANLKDLNFSGGQLTGCLSNSKFLVSNLFDEFIHTDRFWTEYKFNLYQTYQSSTEHRFNDIMIFSELDYISSIKNVVSRGVKVEFQDSSYTNKILIKKGETLSIILGNQIFENLNYLANVSNDINSINELLQSKYHHTLILLQDISYKNFLDTLTFVKRNYDFENGSQILFYAASHGVKDVFGSGGLCFTDTKIDDNYSNSFDLQTLRRIITSLGATNTLMIMDICHSGLAFSDNCQSPTTIEIPLTSPIFTSSFSQQSPAYKNFLNQESNLYFGSSRDQESADGSGLNSPFATVLISFFKSNNLPVIDSYHLQKLIETKVMAEGAISLPTFCAYNGKTDGRFLFIQ